MRMIGIPSVWLHLYVVTEIARGGALSELLYADDLVLMRETI